MIRLDKFLAAAGVGSRDEVKKFIKAGRIRVEGLSKFGPETKIPESAKAWFDGKPVTYSEFRYLMLHKPAGVLTAVSDSRDRTVMELLPQGLRDVTPVGRLDKDTEGLLLFTNDGNLAHRLLAPKNEVKKTYYFECDRDLSTDAAEKLKEPIEFSDFTSKPAELRMESGRKGQITVTEGKFHEVKRLVHAVGADVTYLKRISFGPLCLGDLQKGMVRELTSEETEALKNAVE